MTISIDKVINDIIPVIIGATKKVTGPQVFVKLNATELAAMSTADTGYLWYGKLVCVGLSETMVAAYGSTTTWSSANGATATGGLVGTFYDVHFNKITSTSPVIGTVYFVGVKIAITNV